MYNRLHSILAYTDRQTDGRTHRQTSGHGIVRAMHTRRTVKIEVSPRQPLGTPIFKPWQRSKMWGKRPLVIRRQVCYGPELYVAVSPFNCNHDVTLVHFSHVGHICKTGSANEAWPLTHQSQSPSFLAHHKDSKSLSDLNSITVADTAITLSDSLTK